MKRISVGIIGGGLTGLTAAYHLSKAEINVEILEARPRLGGRILTKYTDQGQVELGATWLGKKHNHLVQLLEELELPIFEQYMGDFAVYDPISTSPPQLVQMPYNPDPTHRIVGGSSRLIDTLKSQFQNFNIHLNCDVNRVLLRENTIEVNSKDKTFNYDFVISTLPPKLLANRIAFEPALPEKLHLISNRTHTWMSESIKVALTYDQPFWKSKHPIGSIFSNTGIVTEMYDHTDKENSKYALKGFINGGYASTSREERLNRILSQLTSYFGPQVNDYLAYDEMVWRDEAYTHFDYDEFILPHQNNGNPEFRMPLFDGKLFIGGSETSSAHPGYMDGAVESGITIAQSILKSLK